MYGLADCNNFFVSCERVFRPDLEGKPVVVLSGNDGCVVSRSNEAKVLGIPMGAPLYQIRELVEREGVTCFSSNFALYGDLSDRVMSVLRAHTMRFEQYSIDEAFLQLDHVPYEEQKKFCEDLVRQIRKGIGIPVSIGIASSRTLAKIASKYAKTYIGYRGACSIRTEDQRQKALSTFKIGDVWGIGRRSRAKLEVMGIKTALDFAHKTPDFAQNVLHKQGLLTWQELNGLDVMDLGEIVGKQSITTSRTFATAIMDLALLEQQIANFCDHCAQQLRAQHSVCSQMIIYAHTSRFRQNIEQQYLSEVVTLPVATASSQELVNYALKALRRSYKQGLPYKKAGVILLKITPDNVQVQDIFDTRDRERDKRLQAAMDKINSLYGKRSILLGPQLDASQGEKVYIAEHKSPLYTTDWSSIITVKC